MENKQDVLHKYFASMQKLTDNILYRVDLATNVLYHTMGNEDTNGLEQAIPNYIETLIKEKLIHPDDADRYIQSCEDFLTSHISDNEFRFAINSKEYKWYKITGDKIYDNHGNVTEIFGALISTDKEHKLKNECNILNKYFDTLQQLTDDILYRVEIDTMTLYHFSNSKRTGGVPKVIPNYVEYFLANNLIHPDDVDKYLDGLQQTLNAASDDIELRFCLLSDDYQWYRHTCQKLFDNDGNLVEVFGALVNIHAQKNANEQLSTLNQYLDAMQSLSDESLYNVDILTKRLLCKGIANQELGLPPVVDGYPESVYDLVHPNQLEEFKEFAAYSISGVNSHTKIQIKTVDGSYKWYELISMIIYNDNGSPVEILGKIKNIDHHMIMAEKATTDIMTGILNKASFREQVSTFLANNNHINGAKYSAFLFFDVDDFKYVNDNFGHAFGDFVLITLAKRVKNRIKRTDIFGRFGGDEFVLFLQDITSEEMILERANDILESIQKTMSNGEFSHNVGVSVGIAIVPKTEITLEQLEEMADKAVYESKKRGKNVVSVYKE